MAEKAFEQLKEDLALLRDDLVRLGKVIREWPHGCESQAEAYDALLRFVIGILDNLSRREPKEVSG